MSPVYVIAEAGVNHNGDPALARQLIDAAKAARGDAVKFQTFKTEKILTRTASMADYQKENLGSEDTQFQMIKALELSFAHFEELKAHAKAIGIEFLSTPDDEDSLDFLSDQMDLPWLKIGSGEVTNLPYLRRIAAKQKPMILSTGMSTLGEVERAVRTIREVNPGQELVLLHCTTNYPCPPEEVNLRAMLTLQRAFGGRVGYSDHTVGTEVPVAAVALGAEMIEKHLTLDKSMEGPDHRASMDPSEFKEMVRQIRVTEQALGNGIKWPNPSEERIKALVRRRVVASRDLPAGTVIEWPLLAFKRADEGIAVEHADQLIGSRLKVAVREDVALAWNAVELAAVPAEPTRGPSVTLTPATPADFEFFLALKSEPDSIYWGGFAAAPDRERLRQHFDQLVVSDTRKTLIVRADGQAAGVISCTVGGGAECTDYSINISGAFSGRGIGRAALQAHVDHLRAHYPRCRTLVAFIRDDNARSQRIFSGSGFVRTDRHENTFLASDQKNVSLDAWTKDLA